MNGNRLTIVVEIPPNVDPTLVDPEDWGGDIAAMVNETLEANGSDPIEFIAAEWGHHL